MTELIAEIGANHQGDEERILNLTKDAISSGIKVLKYQIYTGESLVSERYDPDRVKHFTSFTLSSSVYRQVIDLCANAGIEFMASIWSETLLNEFDPFIKRYKIGSGDLTNYPLIKVMAKKGKPIILSTGLSSLSEVDSVVDFIRATNKIYFDPKFLSILQCTSVYPCPLNEVNLSVVEEYKRRYKTLVGYSHHAIQYSPIYTAISMGVDMIEFHYTDRKHDNQFRDHLISIDASEFQKIKAFYDETLLLRGKPLKQVTKTELSSENCTSFRRSLFYRESHKKGHSLSEKDLECLRPGIGITPNNLVKYIGRTLTCSIEKGELLSDHHFK
jgi:N-acetylneuraminate synthase/N,N'-diacetyllegionaminate synthase